MTKKIVISGAGISGLVSALLLARQGKGKSVYLLDKADEPGGLLRRFNYGEFGDFDYGMHNMLETGISELDEMLFGLLPPEEWQMLEGVQRDIAGVFFDGALQKSSPYFDIRTLPEKDYQECLADFLKHIENAADHEVHTYESAHDFALTRFGPKIAEKIISPVLEKIFKKPSVDLDYMAALFVSLSRVVIAGETLSRELTMSPFLRQFIAWGDQRTLPLERSSGKRGLYPAKYGMYRVVAAIMERLTEAGVHFFRETEIVGINTEAKRVQSVEILQHGVRRSLDDVERLIWTANIPLLGRMLGVDFGGVSHDKPQRTVVVNVLIDKPLEGMDDLYYFFCYDKDFHTYRLTNYPNYCRGAARNGGLPVTIELLVSDEVVKSVDLAALAIDELFRFGVTAPNTKVLFAKAEVLDAGFPMPSLNNTRGLRIIRNRISDMGLANLQLVGILAKENLFFQRDVLVDAYEKSLIT